MFMWRASLLGFIGGRLRDEEIMTTLGMERARAKKARQRLENAAL